MSARSLSLPCLLDSRYELQTVLGEGGFGITYLAVDHRFSIPCVLKELFPSSATRLDGRVAKFGYGESAAQSLLRQFRREAHLLMELRVPGVVRATDTFYANNTCYFVMEFIEGARPLADLIKHRGLDAETTMDFLHSMLEILGQVHAKGIIHYDLKPSNWLVDPSGQLHLIDFGAARQWTAGLTQDTTLFTPGYAALEQMGSEPRRLFTTDIYGLCATIYALLTGSPPPHSVDRANGSELRLDWVEPIALRDLLEAGLQLRAEHRPQSVAELGSLLRPRSRPSARNWETLRDQIHRSERLTIARRECPSCGQVLEVPKLVDQGTCIACRSGKIKSRNLPMTACAVCKVGVLRPTSNTNPLRYCPGCRTGMLKRVGPLAAFGRGNLKCSSCDWELKPERDGARWGDEWKNWSGWRHSSNRAESGFECDSCAAQVDVLEDRRWSLIFPEHKLGRHPLYPVEWARIAAGLDPSGGNAVCDSCRAEYDLEADWLTLIKPGRDSGPRSTRNLGQLLRLEEARWIASGKSSGDKGVLCRSCETEFDTAEDGLLTLIATENHALQRYTLSTLSPLDWKRVAQGLPREDQIQPWIEEKEALIEQAFIQGTLAQDLVFHGDGFKISREGVRMGNKLFGKTLAWDRVIAAESEDDRLILVTEGESFELEIDPASVKIGQEEIIITADILSKRINTSVIHQNLPQ